MCQSRVVLSCTCSSAQQTDLETTKTLLSYSGDTREVIQLLKAPPNGTSSLIVTQRLPLILVDSSIALDSRLPISGGSRSAEPKRA
jgi:hypothetical protein